MELSTTLSVGADTANEVLTLVQRFPHGRRVRVVVTDDAVQTKPAAEAMHPRSFGEYLEQLDEARRLLPTAPWRTSEEAMHELREGERD
jgi:hypothetical protein